jgi:hypothetical protein
VLEVSIFSGSEVDHSDAEPVAHVTGTYSLPPG